MIYLLPTPPLESDKKEAKKRKGIKILTPNTLFHQTFNIICTNKTENNFHKLKSEIRKKCIYFISIIKSPKNLIKSS